MIALSKTTGYAIQALSCLNDPACCCQSITTIAGCSSVPKAYLAKIVNALVRAGLIKAKRGVGGGIALVRPPKEIALLSIVVAVEGEHWIGDCLLGSAKCRDARPCATAAFWKEERGRIETYLQDTTLADVIAFERHASRRSAKTLKTPNHSSS